MTIDLDLFVSTPSRHHVAAPSVAPSVEAEQRQKVWQKTEEKGFDLSYELKPSSAVKKEKEVALTFEELTALEKARLVNQKKSSTLVRAIETKRYFESSPSASATQFALTMANRKGYGLRTIQSLFAIFNRLKDSQY